MVAGDTVIAFVVNEDAQGGGDLNSDGVPNSSDDDILHVWDVANPLPTNTGLGVDVTQFDLAVADETVLFAASQASDGSALARRVHAWSPGGGLVDLGVNAADHTAGQRSGIRSDSGQFSFLASEADSGVDLNGDGVIVGSLDGVVPSVWSPTLGLWHAPAPPGGRVLTQFIEMVGPHVMHIVRENSGSTLPDADLNCDGDFDDDIVHVTALGTTPQVAPCGLRRLCLMVRMGRCLRVRRWWWTGRVRLMMVWLFRMSGRRVRGRLVIL